MNKIDSTIIATVITLIVSFVVMLVYRKIMKFYYIRRFLRAYENDYILSLRNVFEMHLKNNDGPYLYKDEVNKSVKKMIQELSFSREKELNFLSSDYSFEFIRINSYTMALIGNIKKLCENYYLFNDLSRKFDEHQSIIDQEIVKQCLKMLNNFDIEVKKYYKLKFDKIILNDTEISEMIKKFELDLGK
ncbi:hypothetical protein C5L30_001380 [Companilactobacillus farciminis]|uniref:Uncharacterized protein n=1 Tax=Companilactobacillus farciminis TaxID=1612 RepID=A0A4R5NBX6_9LACO|nr:hypothetical protein [Companilactobacillus farciminis]ATO46394.1 hypothetical protein LF20184_06320 [Companilactobacillus farciminis KCTC 3681 = DSM 20184]TDG70589.1 hypothetical protein C5L30_001380 [Companilactobacillus farciminis]